MRLHPASRCGFAPCLTICGLHTIYGLLSSGLRHVTHSATHVCRASSSRGVHSPLRHSNARSERDLHRLHTVGRTRQENPHIGQNFIAYMEIGKRNFALWAAMCNVINALFLYRIAIRSGRFDAIRRWITVHLPRDPRVVLVGVGLCFGALLDGQWLWGVIEWSKAHHYE